MLIVKFYILDNEKKCYYSFKFTIISKFYILENEKNVNMLLFINNFFNIKKKKRLKMLLFIKKLVKKSWLVLKLKVFFIISKKLKKKK